MQPFFRLLFLCCLWATSQQGLAQEQWVFALPISDYILRQDNSTILQTRLPAPFQLAERSIGLLKKNYANNPREQGEIPLRCYLIKQEFYYFAYENKPEHFQAQAGDLIYVMLPAPAVYKGHIAPLAALQISFQSIEDEALSSTWDILRKWQKEDEEVMLQKMLIDIRFTGKYMLEQDASQNLAITEGTYKGKKVLDLMQQCQKQDLLRFLEYVRAAPGKYAGQSWKISEVFATWAQAGAPHPAP